MPATNIDFTTLTHVIHFSVAPNANGTLDSSANTISAANSRRGFSGPRHRSESAHLCWRRRSESLFQSATALPTCVFINNLTNFVATRRYDGVDIDWEPLRPRMPSNTQTGERPALRVEWIFSTKLLTAAVGAYPPYGIPRPQTMSCSPACKRSLTRLT